MTARRVALAFFLLFPSGGAAARSGRASQPERSLRVCADPNNLPFSDSTGAGFENRLASLVAAEMKARVTYTWWAQPYYRSSYVFVSRRDRKLDVRSFDDPLLRRLTVGVQLVGDDYANAPPAYALARRGIVRNVRGFNVQGDYRQASPPARIIDAIATGDVDIAVAWGPLAGYYATREPVPLVVVPVSPPVDPPSLPLAFDIVMGVRRGDRALRDTLNAILIRRRPSIDSLLAMYGVPLLERQSAPRVASGERNIKPKSQ